MMDDASAVPVLSDISDCERPQWVEHIRALCEHRGSFQALGEDHAVARLDQGDTLLVCFDSFERATEQTADGYPRGLALGLSHGWSVLSVLSLTHQNGAPWFRSEALYAYFDALILDGTFDEYERVVFYGAGAAGYAAAAYSVAAPGATVLSIAPQATLNGRLSVWDERHLPARKLDFTSRYGYAPDMVDAAAQAAVLYDPLIREDAMHAALFASSHILKIPVRMFGQDPEFEFIEMGIADELLTLAMSNTLTRSNIAQLLRKRRTHMGYLRTLFRHYRNTDRVLMTALLCRHVLRLNRKGPHFRNAYVAAINAYQKSGRKLPFEPLSFEDELKALDVPSEP